MAEDDEVEVTEGNEIADGDVDLDDVKNNTDDTSTDDNGDAKE